MVNTDTPVNQVIHQFSYGPCQYMDVSWLAEKQPWIANLEGWRLRPALNDWVINEWDLIPVSEATLSYSAHSLVLIPPEPLKKLIMMTGGVLYCQAMRQVVLKEPKQHLNAVFGVEGVKFCIQQGPMLLSEWPLDWQHSLPDDFTPEHLRNQAFELGLTWFRFVLKHVSKSAHQRWRFKLKPTDFYGSPQVVWLEESQRDLAYRLTKKIAKQVIPQWFHLLK
jgi:type III secretion protein K